MGAKIPQSVRENVAIVAAILTPPVLEAFRTAFMAKGRTLTEHEQSEIRAHHVAEWGKMSGVILAELDRTAPGASAASPRGPKREQG